MTAGEVAAPPLRLDPTDVLARLSDLGPPSEVRSRSPAVAADALRLERVLLSGVRDGTLHADALHLSGGGAAQALEALRGSPAALEYPLLEGEIMRRRRAQVVKPAAADASGPHAFADVLGWNDYVTAPIVVESRVVGFFRGDRDRVGAPVDRSDADALASFAALFGIVYERSVLRQRLRMQLREMRSMASWADARAGELGDRPIGLDEDGDGDGDDDDSSVRISRVAPHGLRDLLTRRELEVMQLMVRGDTNGGIARNLVLSEGTVKFHVKNILRKLHATNRADATSRYLRLAQPGSVEPRSRYG